MLSKLGIK